MKKPNPRNYFKPTLAALIFLCIFPMPYDFYNIVRFISMAVFAYFAYDYYQKRNMPFVFTFGTLALLFQPFCRIGIGRGMWTLIDIAVAILLLYIWHKERK